MCFLRINKVVGLGIDLMLNLKRKCKFMLYRWIMSFMVVCSRERGGVLIIVKGNISWD